MTRLGPPVTLKKIIIACNKINIHQVRQDLMNSDAGIKIREITFGEIMSYVERNIKLVLDEETRKAITLLLTKYGLSHLIDKKSRMPLQLSRNKSIDIYILPSAPDMEETVKNAGDSKLKKVEMPKQRFADYYQEHFNQALALTNQLNIQEVNFKHTNKCVLPEILPQMQHWLPATKVEDLAFQCNCISQYVIDLIHKHTNHRAYLTTGTILMDSTDMFSSQNTFDAKFVKDTVNKGLNSLEGVNLSLHSWITLDTMEILDCTFDASFAMKKGEKKDHANIIGKHIGEMKDIWYKPVVIGDEFFKKYDGKRYSIALSNLSNRV